MTTNTPPKPPSPPHHDNLTPLPPEILQQIASYLYATHNPRLAYEEPINPRKPTLLSLSSVNKTLHAQTNAWAHHHLHAHRAITKYKDYKTAQAAARQRPLLKLLRWSAAHCVFCGKNSKRRAILMNGLRCCGACDRVQWAEKITKTKAKKDFRLSEEQLLPGKGVPGFLRVRYGTYWSAGVLTTMFLRRDVERLAKLVKGREAGKGVKGRKKVEGVSKRVEREVEVLERAEAGTSRAVEVRRVGGKEVVVIDDEDD